MVQVYWRQLVSAGKYVVCKYLVLRSTPTAVPGNNKYGTAVQQYGTLLSGGRIIVG